MSKEITAESTIRSLGNSFDYYEDVCYTEQDVVRAMKEFAAYHVKQALDSAWDNWQFEDGCDTHGVDLVEDSIKNAYPLTKII